MDLGLKGKVAMVAGASKGLGYSVAQALAQEGALVSIASRDSAAITTAAHWFNRGYWPIVATFHCVMVVTISAPQ